MFRSEKRRDLVMVWTHPDGIDLPEWSWLLITTGGGFRVRGVNGGPDPGQWGGVHLKALDRWAYENGGTLDLIRPGKPTDLAFVVSCDGRLRDESLNTHWFLWLKDACAEIEAWRRACNESRSYTSIGWLTPIEYAAAAAKIAGE